MAYIDATRRSQVKNHAHAVKAKNQAKMRRKLAALLLAARSSAQINHDCTPSTRRLLDGVKAELRNQRVDGVVAAVEALLTPSVDGVEEPP